MNPVAQIVSGLIQIINTLILVWCLLSWFPNIRWYDQPFKTLDQIVQVIIGPFRKVIPPIANIDLSPMAAIIVLQMVAAGIQMLL